MGRPHDLPDFARPPIDEVAIGVQFVAPIGGFVDAHVGIFWEQVKKLYSSAESHPRVESLIEPLGSSWHQMPQALSIPLQQAAGARTFLLDEEGEYLLQIQNNRFFRNWRKRDEEYPHFEDLATAFQRDYSLFQSFLQEEKLQVTPIALFETTYINWITDLPIANVLKSAASAHLETAGVSDLPQTQTWQASYGINNAEGDPMARLNVQSAPAVRVAPAGFEQGLQLALTFSAPGTPTVPELSVPTLLEAARRCIVRSFAQLTTGEAHEHWGRRQ
jgi:uncharacterized protein (TIGR04255 family)